MKATAHTLRYADRGLQMRRHFRYFMASAVAFCASPRPASALDKQGSAHGGAVGGEETGFGISGNLTLGSSLINPSYAARPDNTGLALFRYAGHADIDLFGRYLSIPLDVNFFTDRERPGARIFGPTEFDVIAGLTSTHTLTRALDLELGARAERDMALDRGSYSQTYADVRSRLLYSLAAASPSLPSSLHGGNISGSLTLGWFAYNPTYAARPDNSGIAAFRYATHTEMSVWKNRFALGIDATFFSNRRATNIFSPTELDLTYEVILREAPFSMHLAYERDMPLDQGGLVQSFVYASLGYDFDLRTRAPAVREH